MNLSNEVVIHKCEGDQEFLQFRRLLKYSSLITNCYSVGVKRNYRTFEANRDSLKNEQYESNINDYKDLCDVNNLNYKNLVKANQNHTGDVFSIKNREYLKEIEQAKYNKKDIDTGDNIRIDTVDMVDGLITNQKNIVLATTNADCILLLFFDPVKKVIANTHSGWKGTLQEISVKTVNKMVDEFGCNPRDIIVCICPCIRKCHFEVGEDVYKMFYNQFEKLGNIEEFITPNGDKWNIDTVLINKILLKKTGILEENIEDCGICSVCNKENIHSFRAEGKGYGLATAIINLNC